MIKIAIASALSLAAFTASAQMYGELGVTAVDIELNDSGSNLESSPTAIRGIVGYELNPNLAIEGLVAFGMNDDNFKVNGATAFGTKFELDNAIGIYAKPKVKFTPELEGFVRAGFARAKGTASGGGQSFSASETGFSYGLGLSYALNKMTSINVDYMSYLDKNDFTATGYTFGVGYKF
jgi:outer membrane autotransporter protein